MISKYNRAGVLLLIMSTLIIILAMPGRRLPLLVGIGPKFWFQYLIAMFGFLGVGTGLFIASMTSPEDAPSYRPFYIITILGGLYVYVMGFVLNVEPRWLGLAVSGVGLMGAAFGFIYFFEVQKRTGYLGRINPDMVKILLLAWMAGLLICFLLYWGAPVEFWQILGRFGINVDEGGLLRNIQHFLDRFFSYS